MDEFDVDGNGIIDSAEWDKVRESVHSEVNRYIQNLHKENKDDVVSHVLRPPEDRLHPYLISNYKELNTIFYYRLYAIGCLVAFLSSVYFMITNTG